MLTQKTFVLLFAILISLPVFAATTGSITIQGAVPHATSIVVTGSAGYNNLDLSANATDLQVATVREKSNVTTGYRVTMTSANAGALKNGTVGSVSYTAKYNNVAVTLSETPQTITDVTSQTSVVNLTKPLTVSFSGESAESMMAGTYSDTLTFTIAAN